MEEGGLISGLSANYLSFPLSKWDHLLPHFYITLNHLQSSRRQPKLSAHVCLFGSFDFHHPTLSVPGTKVLIHKTEKQRRIFSPHSLEGIYVGLDLNHCFCYTCYINPTNAIITAVTLDFFPSTIPLPQVTSNTYLPQMAEDLLTFLQNKEKHPITQLTYGSHLTNAYIQISQIFQIATYCTAQLQPAPTVISLTPVPTPSYRTVPETRVLLTLTPAAPELRVKPVPSPSPVQAPIPSDITPYPVQ